MTSSSNAITVAQQEQNETWKDWGGRKYNESYESWMPWAEDQYLKWFGKDNKASYVAKDTLSKSKVTGVEQVDTLQDGVNDLAAGTVGKGGILQPVGDLASKEGFNRAERGGKDDKGSWVPDGNSLSDGAKGLLGKK